MACPELKKRTAGKQIQDFIVEQVKSGNIPAGKELPTHRDLCRHLGVNRNAMQRVYAALTTMGVLVNHPGYHPLNHVRGQVQHLRYGFGEFNLAEAQRVVKGIKSVLDMQFN